MFDLHPLRRDGFVFRIGVVAIDRFVLHVLFGELALQQREQFWADEVLPVVSILLLLEGRLLRVHLFEVGLVVAQHVRPELAQPRGEIELRLARRGHHGDANVVFHDRPSFALAFRPGIAHNNTAPTPHCTRIRTHPMADLTRVSISLESALLAAFDRSNEARGYATRSEAIRYLIRARLVPQEGPPAHGSAHVP